MPFLRGGGSGAANNQTLGSGSVVLASGNVTTTSASFTDLTGVSFSITTTGGPVLLFAVFRTDNSVSTNRNSFTILRDSTDLSGSTSGIEEHRSSGNGVDDTVVLFYIDTPAAGTYTYKIQWKVNANTGTVYADGTARKVRFFGRELAVKGVTS